MRRIMGFVAVVVALTIAFAAPAFAAATTEQDDVVVLSGTAFVPEGQTVHNVVVFSGSALIEGTVEGNVVAFDAPVTVSGTVNDGIIVFRGLLRIEPGASVSGDVFADRSIVAEGATLESDVRDVGEFGWMFESGFGFIAGLAVWLAVTISVLLLGLIVIWLAPRVIDATVAAARTGTGPAIGWGFGLFVGLPVFGVVVTATLVGIPFGIGLLLALAMIYALGHTASAWILGRVLVAEPHRRVAAFLAGWAILAGGTLVPWVGGLVWFAATVFGLGAIAVAVWRSRRVARAELGARPVMTPLPPAPTPMGA
jgi:hypothetical protein